LRRDDDPADPLARPGAGLPAAPVQERLARVAPRRAPGGQHAEREGHQARQARGEAEHRPAQRDLVEPRQVGRREGQQPAHAERGDHHARQAAGRRQHERLGDELPRDPAASRAERVADREFALARGSLREEQVRHVRARDEEQEEDGAEENVQGRPDAAGERRLQRHRLRVREEVLALLGRVADHVFRDGAQVGAGLRHRDTVSQAPDRVVVV
jgi:hypothetical protein